MNSNIITSTEGFCDLREDWEWLQKQDKDITYYNTFEYLRNWWDVYKYDKDIRLFIICVKEEEKIIGIAPLMIQTIQKNIFSYNKLTFLGQGDYFNFLISKENRNTDRIFKKIFNEIEINMGQYERICFTHIKYDSLLASYILKSDKYNKYFTYLIECPYIYTPLYKNFQEYKKQFISHKKIQKKNKLATEQNYSFNVVINNKINVINDISEIHKREQEFLVKDKKRLDRKSLFNNEKKSRFLTNLYKGNENVVTFLLKNMEGKIICYDTCYLYNRTLHSWNSGYDPEYALYSPNEINTFEIINYLYNSCIADKFDLGAGRYPWKFRWTDRFEFLYKLDFWNEKNNKGKVLGKIWDIKNKF